MEEKIIRDPHPGQEADISSKLNNTEQTDDGPADDGTLVPEAEDSAGDTAPLSGRGDFSDESGQSPDNDYPEDHGAGMPKDSGPAGSEKDIAPGSSGKDRISGKDSASTGSATENGSVDSVKETASADSGEESGSGSSGKDRDSAGARKQKGSGKKSPEQGKTAEEKETGEPGEKEKPVKKEKTGKEEKPVKKEKTGKEGKSAKKEKTGKEEKSAKKEKTGKEEKNVKKEKTGQKEKDGKAEGKRSKKTKDGKRADIENTLDKVREDTKKTPQKGRTDSYEEKLIRHKRRLYRRTLFLVALVTILLMTAVILWMRRGYSRAELRRVATFTVEDGAEFVSLGKNIVRYSGSGAVCMDRRGNTRWSVSYEMQQPITSVNGDVVAIANRSGYNVYVMNTQGVMGTIETMLPIHSIAASKSGEVAVVMNDQKATWIRLYTATGKEIAYIIQTMAENGYPVSAAVSPDGKTLCLSSVQMSNAAVKSNVSFYNFGREGKKAADHRVDYADFIDEVVPYTEYLDDSTCAGISDKRLILFRRTLLGKSGSSSILFSENLQGVFSGENFIGLLFNNTSQKEQYRLDIYNRRGKKAGTISFTMQYKDIKIVGDKVYINNDRQCQIFTLSGRCLFDGELDRSISALIPGAGLSDLLVVTGGEIDSVNLH